MRRTENGYEASCDARFAPTPRSVWHVAGLFWWRSRISRVDVDLAVGEEFECPMVLKISDAVDGARHSVV